jgi:hypothetical protein
MRDGMTRSDVVRGGWARRTSLPGERPHVGDEERADVSAVLLGGGRVCDAAASVGRSHVTVLRAAHDAGLVYDRRAGRWLDGGE